MMKLCFSLNGGEQVRRHGSVSHTLFTFLVLAVSYGLPLCSDLIELVYVKLKFYEFVRFFFFFTWGKMDD